MSDLTDPEIQPLWQAIKDRLVRDGDLATIRNVRVKLSDDGRARINGWLARANPRMPRLTERGDWTFVSVDRVLAALQLPRSSLPKILARTVDMPELLQPHRRAAALKRDFWSAAEAALPHAPQLVQYLRAAGINESTHQDRRRLIEALARAHDLLPIQRPVPLPRLSYYCAADPHYFDFAPPGRGHKLAMLVAEILHGAPAPTNPAQRFHLLAGAGIYPDRLSTTVLTLNLAADGPGPVDEAIRAARAFRRPLHLSMYDLTVYRPVIQPNQPVLIVENPSVVEEAIHRGYRGPLACTSGALSAVDHEFLQLLASTGVPIRYSGDDDPAGLAIAAVVSSQYGAEIIGLSNPAESEPSDPARQGTEVDPAGIPRVPIYQEDPGYLDALLGPDPADPLP